MILRQIPPPPTLPTDWLPDCLPTTEGKRYNPRRPVTGGGATKGYGREGRPIGGRHSERQREQWRTYKRRVMQGAA